MRKIFQTRLLGAFSITTLSFALQRQMWLHTSKPRSMFYQYFFHACGCQFNWVRASAKKAKNNKRLALINRISFLLRKHFVSLPWFWVKLVKFMSPRDKNYHSGLHKRKRSIIFQLYTFTQTLMHRLQFCLQT